MPCAARKVVVNYAETIKNPGTWAGVRPVFPGSHFIVVSIPGSHPYIIDTRKGA